MASRSQFLFRTLAMLLLVGVVWIIFQETSTSGTQVDAQRRVRALGQQIADVERQNVSLRERVDYARSVEATREIAKRELGLVDPGDRAIVILDDLRDPPSARPPPLPVPSPAPDEPIEFGYLGAWLRLFFGVSPTDLGP